MSKKTIWILIAVALISLIAGWFVHGLFGRPQNAAPAAGAAAGKMPLAAVNAIVVQESYLQPIDKYIAEVEPIEDVLVRTEVSGYIEKVHFTEGGEVKQGDILFTIDQSRYKAMVATREAELAQAQAELTRAQKYYKRMQDVDARSISQSDLDTAESDLLRAEADVKRAQAELTTAKIDLDYSEIKAPVNGRIGAAEVTKGNYVTSSSGPLARIVQFKPIRVVFSLTDREYLAFRQKELSGAAESRVAKIRLPDGTALPSTGKKDFDDNAMNPGTGTIAVRYLFENKDELLVPGGYVTALLENPNGEKGILIPQRAVLVDQQGSYVLIVDEQDVVAPVRIEPGKQIGSDIIVLSGLTPGNRVVVDGVQKARPGTKVQVTLLEAE